MFKKIALFCALIGVTILLTSSAYAEVQNIKVSGDIQALGVFRSNYDLEDESWALPQGIGLNPDNRRAEDDDSFFQSIVRLRVDADLTDNVSATVRLANLREWDVQNAGLEDIYVDLAYVTLKEMLYSPLTLIVGRQELLYGTGLIVGPGLFQDPDGSIKYDDLSPLHGFDAVRAILDYDPWTLDLVLAKMTESDDAARAAGTQNEGSDIDLYGANLGYKFASYEAEIEGYLWYKRDEAYALSINLAGSPSNGRTFEENKVYTAGLRGSVVPIENLTLKGEVAGQWGEISDQQAGPDDNPLERDRQALLGNVAGEYEFADTRFTPTLGIEYLYLSGEEAEQNGDFESWDPMYRSRFSGSIRDALENIYTTNDPGDTSGWTNQHSVKAFGSLDLGELVDGLTLDLAYLHYWFAEEPIAGADDEIGNEVTARLTYDYTEDVQFLLDGAWFIPGDYYDELHTGTGPVSGGGITTSNTATNRVSNDTAVSIIGSLKVTF
jgi:hypothetical protein